MAKTVAERQKEFRKRKAADFKKLEVLLPGNEFALLHDNAKEQGLTKAKYIVSLLHGNYSDNKEITQPNNAIDLIQQNKELAKENVRLTKKANEEHLSKKKLEVQHDRQLKGLNDLIYSLNDKPLKVRNDELEAEVIVLKDQIKNHTQTTQQLERDNKKLVDKASSPAYDGSTRLQPAISGLIGCSPKSYHIIANVIGSAKNKLNIPAKSKKMTIQRKLEIYTEILQNLEDYKTLPRGKAGKA